MKRREVLIMAFLCFGKKKDKKEKTIEQSIVENIAKDASPENAVITYILLQSQKNSVSLAKKEDITYISFRNKEISDFLKEWYTLLQLHQHKRLSDKMYEIFIQSQLAENKITEDKEKLSDNIEDFVDF